MKSAVLAVCLRGDLLHVAHKTVRFEIYGLGFRAWDIAVCLNGDPSEVEHTAEASSDECLGFRV